jgi:hypothetical protein
MSQEHKHYTEIPYDGWDCPREVVMTELGWSAGDAPIQVDTEGRVIWAPAVDELRAERDKLAEALGAERSMHEEARARHFRAMRAKQLEVDEARQAAYELSLDTHDDFKLSLFMHKYPWLEERHR